MSALRSPGLEENLVVVAIDAGDRVLVLPRANGDPTPYVGPSGRAAAVRRARDLNARRGRTAPFDAVVRGPDGRTSEIPVPDPRAIRFSIRSFVTGREIPY